LFLYLIVVEIGVLAGELEYTCGPPIVEGGSFGTANIFNVEKPIPVLLSLEEIGILYQIYARTIDSIYLHETALQLYSLDAVPRGGPAYLATPTDWGTCHDVTLLSNNNSVHSWTEHYGTLADRVLVESWFVDFQLKSDENEVCRASYSVAEDIQ